MATLTNQTIAASYEQLLSLPNGGLNGTSLVAITDGDSDTACCLQISTTKALIEGNGSTLYFFDEGGEYIKADNAGKLTIAAAAEVEVNTAIYDLNATGQVQTYTQADWSISAETTVDLDAVGVMQINSSGGTINIGNDAAAYAMNIGTGAAARVITIGNVTGATQVVLNAGTAGISLASTGAGDITIDSDDTLLLDADGILELNSSAGAISIGNDNIDQTINIATGGTRALNIGITDGTDLTTTTVKGLTIIDTDRSGVGAENVRGFHVDFDRADPGSGTDVHNDIGIDVDVNSSSKGTSSIIGVDVDVVGAGTGTQTATGLDVNVSGGDTNYAALFDGGYVGIGVATPGYPLQVNGKGTNDYIAFFNNGTASSTSHGIRISAGDADHADSDTHYIEFQESDGDVVGELDSNSGNLGLTDTSDERLKKDIVDTKTKGLEIINGARMRDFKWKKNGLPVECGMIAQELEKVYPRAVRSRDDEDNTLRIRKTDFIYILVKAVQELSAKVTALENA